MEINSQSFSQATTGNTAAAGSSAKAISSDFETFLKMLTVQMQNQDPLNPVDSSDYAVQLATFSGVEQQAQTNDLLKGLTALDGGEAEWRRWRLGSAKRHARPPLQILTAIRSRLHPIQPASRTVLQIVVSDADGVGGRAI